MGVARRGRVLAAAVAVCLGLVPAGAGRTQAPPPPAGPPFVLTMIAPGVYAAINGPSRKAGSNGGFVIGDDAVLVVDSFVNPESAQALLAEIRRITPKPIRYLVNTHYHLDHVSGDGVFHDAGALIVAHRNVRGWIAAQNIALMEGFGNKVDAATRARFEALPKPDVVTDQPLSLWLGSRRVDLLPRRGHTGGDLAVYVPDAHVVFGGDLLWRKTGPTIVDSNIKIAIDELAAFQRFPDAAATTYVPGHGELMKVGDVADYQAHLADLMAATAEARKAGLTGDAEVEAVKAKLKPRYGDWAGFDRGTAFEVRAMDEELAGTKKVPIPAKE